jgi:hypothetical protein
MKKEMKRYSALLIAAAMATFAAGAQAVPRHKMKAPARPRNGIAVVRSKYDDIDAILHNYRIPHDLLECRDLESPERVAGYRSLFVPSGVDHPLEESLDVYANNFRFKSVTLKPDFYEVDKDRIGRTLRKFVRGGGSLYVSGFSFEYLQRAFDMFEFFDNFPYMGLPARIEADVRNDLSRFSMRNRMALYYDHPGWIALRAARSAEVVASGSFETARGVRTGPLLLLARRGDGEVLYTSYDSTAFSDFRRFNIYRIAGAQMMEDLEDVAWKWGQHVTGRIVNAIHGGEPAAMHRVDLDSGINYIYFHSAREYYQVDIVDRDLSLIESRDLLDRDQSFVVDSSGNDYCYIRLYPATGERFGMYAVVSASGRRTVPYRYCLLAVLGALAVAGLGYLVYRNFLSTGYSGRWRG